MAQIIEFPNKQNKLKHIELTMQDMELRTDKLLEYLEELDAMVKFQGRTITLLCREIAKLRST